MRQIGMRPHFIGLDWLIRQIGREGYPLLHGALSALCVLGAVLNEELRLPFTFAAGLLLPSQICLIGLWTTLSTANASVRCERMLLWSGSFYFCILAPASLAAAQLPTTWPLWLALAMGGLLVGTLLGCALNRRNGWRLEDASPERDQAPQQRRPLQFGLWDAFRWTTTICIFLALGVMTVPRFAAGEPTASISGGDLARLLLGSGIVSLGLGMFAALVLWLVLADTDASSSFFRRCWKLLVVLFLFALWLDQGGSFGMGPPPFQFVFGVAFGFGLPLAVNGLILREFGWRLVRAAANAQRQA